MTGQSICKYIVLVSTTTTIRVEGIRKESWFFIQFCVFLRSLWLKLSLVTILLFAMQVQIYQNKYTGQDL